MLPSQSLGIFRSEFVAPEANGLVADGHAPLGQQVFNITMTKVESVIEPDGVLDDFGRESVALVHF